MNQQNMHKVALITGASRGIGAAIAERLATDGFSVVINYAGNQVMAEELAHQLELNGAKAVAIQADISDSNAVKRLFDEAEKAFGRIDVLVNNAGIMTLSTVEEMEDTEVDKLLDINLKGTFYTLREAAKRLQHGGRIINFSSSVVGLLQPGYGLYAATKAGVEALTSVMAKELRGRDITVNSIAPGPTATELFLNGKSPELIEKLAQLAPLGRLGQPEDIAATVSFLAGPDGAWVNGQTLRANGGII